MCAKAVELDFLQTGTIVGLVVAKTGYTNRANPIEQIIDCPHLNWGNSGVVVGIAFLMR